MQLEYKKDLIHSILTSQTMVDRFNSDSELLFKEMGMGSKITLPSLYKLNPRVFLFSADFLDQHFSAFYQKPEDIAMLNQLEDAYGNLNLQDELAKNFLSRVVLPPFELPLPFESIWIECFENASLVVSKPFNKHVIAMMIHKSSNDSYFVFNYGDAVQDMSAAKQPGMVAPIGHINKEQLTNSKINAGVRLSSCLLHIKIFNLLNFISSSKCKAYTQDNTSQRIKLKLDGEKAISKIKKYIFITDRKKSSKPKIPNLTPIEFSHAFEVRGHWREIFGRFGHDPKGDLIKNFTWVSPYWKNKDHPNQVIKTRVDRYQ